MKNTSNSNKRILSIPAWITSALVLAFGLALLIKPRMATTIILNVVSVGLIVAGAYFAIRYLLSGKNDPANDFRLATGITLAAIGVAVMICKRMLVSFVPLIFGIFLFVSGVTKIQFSTNMRRMSYGRWWLTLVGAGVSIVCGIIIIVNPFSSALVLIRIIGGVLALEAVQDLLSAHSYDKAVKTYFVD